MIWFNKHLSWLKCIGVEKKIKKNLIVKCLSSLDFHTSECTDMWIQFNDEKLKTT